MRLKKRTLTGQEAIEVAIVGGIVLCLSIAAVVFFGDNIKKVFMGTSSPVIVSANLKDSSDLSDANGAGSRTNADKSLVTTSFISKSHSDSSIGSEIALETTGAAGGDAAIGGTYIIDDPAALTDGDPSTTGNTLLDAALAAKKSAEALLNSALSTSEKANILANVVTTIQDKIVNETSILDTLNLQAASIANDIAQLQVNMESILELYNSAYGFGIDIQSAINSIANIDQLALDITNQNILTGQTLEQINQQYLDAQDTYNSLKNAYEAGWTTDCSEIDIDTGLPICVDINTSGITDEQLNTSLAQVSLLQSNLNGQLSAINDTIKEAEDKLADLKEDLDDAEKKAKDLKKDAFETLKKSFWDPFLFSSCDWGDLSCVLDKTNWALANNYSIKNKDAAIEASKLLTKAVAAYASVDALQLQVDLAQANLNQLNQVVNNMGGDPIVGITVNASNLINTGNANANLLLNSNTYVNTMANQIAALQQALLDTNNLITSQQSYIDTMNTQLANAVTNATTAQDGATTLLTDAQAAVDQAQVVINTIVTYPNP